MKRISSESMLKTVCWLGAVVDGLLAIMWFLIACGYNLPNLLSGYVGHGVDYQQAMYIAAMFMATWAVLLIWCAQKPVDRKGLLMIGACFIFLSVILELLFWRDLFKGIGFTFGVLKRLFLSGLFTYAYFYSSKTE
ncbi:MAG: hypothetical protein PHD54_14065 [Desulfuromonadaceae bacterium]|nr:hypothetical protein [Desulfuromonadaceae bacterium]